MGKNLKKLVAIASILAVTTNVSMSLRATEVNAATTSLSIIANHGNTNLLKAGPDLATGTYTISSSVEPEKPAELNTDTAKNFEYTVENGAVTLIKYIGTPDTNGAVNIDKFINNLPITKIAANAFSTNCENIKTIQIGTNISDIETDAFSGCTGLKKFTIATGNTTFTCSTYDNSSLLKGSTLVKVPQALQANYYSPEGITELSDDAFEGCNIIQTINIPSTLKSIGSGNADTSLAKSFSTFKDCKSLQNISVDPSNTHFIAVNGILFNNDKTKLIKCPQSAIFSNSTYTTDSTVNTISDYAFQGCSNLKGVNLYSVTNIGNHAFDGSTLNAISLDDSLTSIGNYAFKGCKSLPSIVIKKAVQTIGYGAFNDCVSLDTFNVENENKHFFAKNNILFAYCTEQSNNHNALPVDQPLNAIIVRVPETITDDQFKTNVIEKIPAVTNAAINYPEFDITGIDAYAFQGCTGLKKITIPQTISSIGGSAFEDCSGLTEIHLPTNSYTLGTYVFDNCTSLPNIDVSYATGIDQYTFNNCSSLTKVTFSSTVQNVNSNAFDGCLNLEAIEAQSKDSLAKPNYYTDPSSGVLYNIMNGKKVLVKYPTTAKDSDGKIITKYKIPDDTTKIQNYAFRDSGNIQEVKTINLTSVDLPSQNLEYDDLAFFEPKYDDSDAGKTFISKIIEGDISNPKYFLIGSDGVHSTLVKVKASTVNGKISIPADQDIRQIHANAFSGVEAGTVYIPSSVTDIDGTAFDNSKVGAFSVESTSNCFESINDVLYQFPAQDTTKVATNTTDKNANRKLLLLKYPTKAVVDKFITADGTTEIKKNAFEDTNLVSITLGKDVSSVSANSFNNNQKLKSINVDANNTDFASDAKGVLYNHSFTRLINYPAGRTEDSYQLPNTVVTLDPYSFSYNSDITSVTSPNSSTLTTTNAFDGTKILKITPLSISSISIVDSKVRTKYTVGDDFDTNNSSLRVVYSDNSVADIPITSDMVSGYDKTKVGNQTLTITYQGQTAQYNVTLQAASTGTSTTTDGQSTTAKTADTSNIFLPASLATIAMTSLAFVGIRKKSEEEN